jgi:hypothetical protein
VGCYFAAFARTLLDAHLILSLSLSSFHLTQFTLHLRVPSPPLTNSSFLPLLSCVHVAIPPNPTLSLPTTLHPQAQRPLPRFLARHLHLDSHSYSLNQQNGSPETKLVLAPSPLFLLNPGRALAHSFANPKSLTLQIFVPSSRPCRVNRTSNLLILVPAGRYAFF